MMLMNRLREMTLPVVATFLVTLALNACVDYFSRQFGSVILGPPFDFGGNRYYLPLDIANFENAPIDGLRVTVPSYIEPFRITSAAPVTISQIVNEVHGPGTKTLVLGGLEPHRVTRLLLPVASLADSQSLRIQNHKNLRLEMQSASDIENPVLRSLLFVLLNSTVYAILLGLLYWTIGGKLVNLRQRITDEKKESKERLEEAKETSGEQLERVVKVEKELRDYNYDSLRTKILLLARISDYAKELQFWRDTVRKVLVSSAAGRANDAELLIAEITSTLKTYSTRDTKSAYDFETINVLAGLLSATKQQPE
jgi:hypothetical protein